MSSWTDWVAGGEMSLLEGRRIFHRQAGPADGRPVTLVHGYPTSSHDWEPVLGGLVRAGMAVTALDLLGFGASEKPQGHDYSLLEQASIVEALWNRLGIGDTALVLHDYGVSVGQELLARDPERITAAAFLNGGLYPDLHRPILVQRLMHSPAGRLLGPLSSERLYRASLGQILGRPLDGELLGELWRATSADGGRLVQHRLLAYIDERRRHAARWREALEGYRGPVGFIWGPADPISGAHVLARLRERCAHARFWELDDRPPVGHYPQLEDPESVAAALVEFLTG